jgi:predicted Fe-Mo cluster-binding NifX family protein
MRIALPIELTEEEMPRLAGEFSRAGLFAIYDVHDETRAVGYVGRSAVAEPGCGRTPGALKEQGVEVVMAHGISQNAVNHLLEMGIVAIKDAPVLSPDALIAHLVSGTLQATPPDMAMHGGCGSGAGCGHCGGAERHAHMHEGDAQGACGGGTTCGGETSN